MYSPTGGQHAVYHTGVEIFRAEYVFGGGDSSACGVSAQAPRVPPPGSGWIFYQSIEIGEMQMSKQQALTVLADVKREFPGNSYDLVSRNCNHFSEALCQRLCGRSLPSWINRLAGVGAALQNTVGKAAGVGPVAKAGAPGKGEGGGGPAAVGLVARTNADGTLDNEVDWACAGVLNTSEADPTTALRSSNGVSSQEESPELLVLLPFECPVKLRELVLEAPTAALAPRRARLFANHRDLDMDDASGGTAPTQEFAALAWKPTASGHLAASLEVNVLKFNNLSFLAVYLDRGGEPGEAGPSITLKGLRLLGKV